MRTLSRTTTMKWVGLCLFLIALPTLTGCDSLKGTTAVAGMGVLQATQARPDRILTYDLEFQTSDNKTLVFRGSTECPHSSSTVGAGYRTNTPEAMIHSEGQQWILSGINCQQEIVGGGQGRYVLYKVINANLAKTYFVGEGSARLTRSAVSSAWGSSTGSPVYLNKHHHGPYIYQKWFLASTPSLVSAQTDPVVLYEGRSPCGIANERGLQLERRVFFETFERRPDLIAIEEGVLKYDEVQKVWKPRAGIQASSPMDAVALQGGTAGCLTFGVAERKFVVSDSTRFSWLYIPEERALYRFARASRAPADAWSNTEWEACAAPANPSNFFLGKAYLIENKPGWPPKFTRKEADGSFSCKGKFPPVLGSSSWD